MLTTLKRTIRSLRRSPVFVAVATLSLAVGLGLSTATFAIVDSTLHPKIPLAELDRLFWEELRLGNQKHPPSQLEQVEAISALPGIERVSAVATTNSRVIADGNETIQYLSYSTPEFFATIGVTPGLGRLPSEDEIRAQSAVVLTLPAWRRLFPKRQTLDGATLTIDDNDFSVVGVLPLGVERLLSTDIWLPTTTVLSDREHRWRSIIVKLKRGMDSVSIQPQLATVAANFTAAYAPPSAPPYQLRLRGMRPSRARLRDNELPLLMIGVALGILAIACTNVSALALARGLTRRRDYALRVALGASRVAIAGEVLSEVAILSVIWTVAGFLIAIALVGALAHLVPEDLTFRGYLIPELNPRVFGITTLALVTGMLIAGGIPAWRASRANPSDPLKDNAGTTTGRARSEFKILVIGELAIAMALLMLASLMTLSTRNVVQYDFGFDARRLLGAHISLPSGRKDTLTDERKGELLLAAGQRLVDLPGVAAVSSMTWGRVDDEHVISDVGREAPPLPLRSYQDVGPNFFATIGAPLISGRDFIEGDRTRGAVILSQRAATLLFPHGDAVGRMVKLGSERSNRAWLPVIGVARDIHLGFTPDPDWRVDTLIYASTSDWSRGYSELVVRPKHADAALGVTMQHTLRAGLPPRSYITVTPFVSYYDQVIRLIRFYDQLFSFLGTASLLLGAAGLFSVLSYTVSQRLREFAVRQALGATPLNVLRLVLRSGFELALGGTAFGALLSFWASAGVSTVLFGVKNTDPVSLIVAEATLLAVTMLASLVPAIRAMRADPVEVLRAT